VPTVPSDPSTDRPDAPLAPAAPLRGADAPLDALRVRLDGRLALPDEPGYAAAQPWNVAIPVRPAAVVAARCPRDVAEAVRFAGEHGLRVAVQRTGHGALPLDADDVLLVHTGALTDLQVDPVGRTARVGAGCVWQQVIEAAAPHGLVPLCGSAPGVGVAGFLTGGGIGPLVRSQGLSADRVRAIEVVTGEGRILRATPEQHSDLFWGLRGGKGTLGIVTAVELELLPLREVHGGAVYFDGADADAVVRTWARWAPSLPEHADTSIALLQLPPLPAVPEPLAGRPTVAVRFASVAGDDAAAALLEELRAVATPLIDAVGPLPTSALGAIHADPVDPMPVHEGHALLRALPDDAVDALLAIAGPAAGSPQVIVELRLLGGALARAPRHASAFCQRDAAFSLCTIGVLAPPVAEAVPAHATALAAALEPWSTGGRLPNFAPSPDPAVNDRCYDAPTRAHLATLAAQHDPRGVLAVGQVVRSGAPA
jgi:hypothetical protein